MIEIVLLIWIGMQLNAPIWYTILLMILAVGKTLRIVKECAE